MLQSCFKKLFCLIFCLFCLRISFFLVFSSSAILSPVPFSGEVFSTLQSQSGYSLSSKAIGSWPSLYIFRFSCVPAGHEDFTRGEDAVLPMDVCCCSMRIVPFMNGLLKMNIVLEAIVTLYRALIVFYLNYSAVYLLCILHFIGSVFL